MTNEPSTKNPDSQDSSIVPISEETKTLVEQKMTDESDEIKQKMGELIELIKKRAESELDQIGELSREEYIRVINQAKETLKKTEDFFGEQQQSLEAKLQELGDEANKNWESFLKDVEKMGNRIDKAVNAAWKALTEPESES